uniref:Uncharacterized protein n=1 Tax=Candidatus Methanogaster sp. ANME-2c ERB4 TaxID=2759911 RepID=A0A7G9YE64_9EURY|nr:hypothetical protein ALDOFIIM_00005 [Methanosarcinales archaeon ANME-2c ERB4]QNO44933.1 hypothetical protein DMHHAFJO_00004 [Methanosarcinales archaeon ANME-2c ERB4]QNO46298.1 hypothetical protein FKGNILIC_00005 [Methanosarcinales archaeon ANME-2c ERB4]
MGKISSERIIQRASSTCSVHNSKHFVPHRKKQSFAPEGLDGCGNCSNQRHDLLQTPKRKVNCGRCCCAAPVFQENELQSSPPYTRDRRWIRQAWQVRSYLLYLEMFFHWYASHTFFVICSENSHTTKITSGNRGRQTLLNRIKSPKLPSLHL